MVKRRTFRLRLPSRTLVLGERTLVMGVLNVTPDSFSDGGKFLDPQEAVEHALAMERDGADLLDVGGESTRPGSTGTSAETELARILPVLEGLRGVLKIPIPSIRARPKWPKRRSPQAPKSSTTFPASRAIRESPRWPRGAAFR